DLGNEAPLALPLELADAQAAVDQDGLAQAHRLGDVVTEPAPAADGEEGLVAVTPFLELLVEIAAGRGDAQGGDPGTVGKRVLSRLRRGVADERDIDVVHASTSHLADPHARRLRATAPPPPPPSAHRIPFCGHRPPGARALWKSRARPARAPGLSRQQDDPRKQSGNRHPPQTPAQPRNPHPPGTGAGPQRAAGRPAEAK